MIDKATKLDIYQDTVNIVKNAVNGLAASEIPSHEVKTLIDETYDALLDLRKRIENGKDDPENDSEFDDFD